MSRWIFTFWLHHNIIMGKRTFTISGLCCGHYGEQRSSWVYSPTCVWSWGGSYNQGRIQNDIFLLHTYNRDLVLDLSDGQIFVAMVFFLNLMRYQCFWTHVPTLLTNAIIWIWQLLTRFFDVMFFTIFGLFSWLFTVFSWLFIFFFYQKALMMVNLEVAIFLLNHQDWCFWDRAMFFEVRWPSYAIICNVCYVSLKSAWYVYT